MVELTIKALFRSVLGSLPRRWYAAQANIRDNVLPGESHEFYLKGQMLCWRNILQRVADGCLAQDSEKAYYSWLNEYRNGLTEVCSTDDAKGNEYMRGQVDAFNDFLKHFLHVSKSRDPAYSEKMESIREKQREVDILKEELEEMMWSLDVPEPEPGAEVQALEGGEDAVSTV